jgi:hypothetical protein
VRLIHQVRWWKFRRSYRRQLIPKEPHTSLEWRPESPLGSKMVLGKDA